jgi:hypothetical protein
MSEKEQITAWVTKYALTVGVKKVKGEVCHGGNSEMLSYDRYSHAHGKDWHRTSEAARIDAERRRTAKIASLKKQIAKLEALQIVIPE